MNNRKKSLNNISAKTGIGPAKNHPARVRRFAAQAADFGFTALANQLR
jgi:hypothetical protein